MSLIYVIRCLEGFKDGNVWPRAIKPNEVLEVSEDQYKRFVQSDPMGFELMHRLVPPSTAFKPKGKKKDAQKTS